MKKGVEFHYEIHVGYDWDDRRDKAFQEIDTRFLELHICVQHFGTAQL